jgi:hypothetical protein
MPLTLQNSEEQAMHDLIIVAGWEILEGKHTWVVKSPSGVMFAVSYRPPERPVIYDIFDTFIRYVNKPHKHLSI